MDKIKLGAEQEIYLESETEKIKNAKEIADFSLEAKKYEYIIEYAPGEKETIITELKKLGCEEMKHLDFANCVAVSMSIAQLKAIKTLECVEAVEMDYDYRILSNSMNEGEYVTYLTGENPNINIGKEVKLAIFDTGVSNVSVNGFINFVNDTIKDENGHGTQMAGIVSSVISDAENRKATPCIWSVVIANHRGFTKTSVIMEALDWAINNEIQIINMSFGDYHKSALLEKMINKTASYGIIMVAAVGNDGAFKDENRIMYPAAFANVLSVGAKSGETVANYSNGGTNADCFASGMQNTTDTNGNPINIVGTSGATAFVSGTILKNWCANPEKNAADIVTDIKTEMSISTCVDNTETLTNNLENDIVTNEKEEQILITDVTESIEESFDNSAVVMSVSDNTRSSNDMSSAIRLPFIYWRSGSIDCPGDEVWYKFTANANGVHPNGSPGWYTVHTQGSLDTIGYLYDSYGNQIAYDDDGSIDLNFNFWAQLIYGETYYIRVRAFGNNTGDFGIRVSYNSDDHGNTINTATEIPSIYYEDKSVTAHLHNQNDVDYYTFVPDRNFVMEIYTEGDTNTYGQLYCASGGLLDSDNNSNGNGNFKITAHLEAMKRYYIAVSRGSSTGSGDYTLRCKFVKDYCSISNDYYSNQKKPIIAWYNNSYLENPPPPEYYSIKYHMFMNKRSALLWRDNFLTNESLATALQEAIENNMPSNIDLILHNSGLETIDAGSTFISIIAECIMILITPYIDRAIFNEEYEDMNVSELMDITYGTTYVIDTPSFGNTLPSGRYVSAYMYDTITSNFVYGEPYFRGEWGTIVLK